MLNQAIFFSIIHKTARTLVDPPNHHMDTNVFLLYLNELFYRIHKFIEKLNMCSRIRTKCAEQKCVQCDKYQNGGSGTCLWEVNI